MSFDTAGGFRLNADINNNFIDATENGERITVGGNSGTGGSGRNTISFDSNMLNDFDTDGLELTTLDSSVSQFLITGNTVDGTQNFGASSPQNGIDLLATGIGFTGTLDLTLQGNTVADFTDDQITIAGPTGTGTIRALIDNNVVSSAVATGEGIQVDIDDAMDVDATITNNQIDVGAGQNSVQIDSGGTGASDVNVDITGNTGSGGSGAPVGDFSLNQTGTGTLGITQASVAALQTANNNVTANTTGTIGTGVTVDTVSLLAAGGDGLGGSAAAGLSEADTDALLAAAANRWAATGLSSFERALLATASVTVVDLPGDQLASTFVTAIKVDANAASHGWFVDGTPGDDAEFDALAAAASGPAAGRIDLLTTLMHELGHIIGKSHADTPGLMAEALAVGVRHLPADLNADSVDILA